MVDLPTIDARRTGQSYRYCYAPHIDLNVTAQKQIPNYYPALIQFDQVNHTSSVHRFPPGHYCGEASFVPQAGSQSEQEGYVITYVFDQNRQASDLVILDAANFSGGGDRPNPLASEGPQRLPWCLDSPVE